MFSLPSGTKQSSFLIFAKKSRKNPIKNEEETFADYLWTACSDSKGFILCKPAVLQTAFYYPLASFHFVSVLVFLR